MTKVQRRKKATRTAAKTRKARTVRDFFRKMNPAKKNVTAVRMKKLRGGGITIIPIKSKVIAR